MDIDSTDTPMPDAHSPSPSSRRRMVGVGVAGVVGSLLPMLLSGRGATAAPPRTSTSGGSSGTTPGGGNPGPGGANSTLASTSTTVSRPSVTTATSSPSTTAAPAAPAAPVAPTTTAPPRRPTDADVTLLNSTLSVSLTAVALYDAALANGALDGDARTVFGVIREAHQSYGQSQSALLGKGATGSVSSTIRTRFERALTTGTAASLITAAHDLESAIAATLADALGKLASTDSAELLASILLPVSRHCVVLADLGGTTDLDALLLNRAQPLRTEG